MVAHLEKLLPREDTFGQRAILYDFLDTQTRIYLYQRILWLHHTLMLQIIYIIMVSGRLSDFSEWSGSFQPCHFQPFLRAKSLRELQFLDVRAHELLLYLCLMRLLKLQDVSA